MKSDRSDIAADLVGVVFNCHFLTWKWTLGYAPTGRSKTNWLPAGNKNTTGTSSLSKRGCAVRRWCFLCCCISFLLSSRQGHCWCYKWLSLADGNVVTLVVCWCLWLQVFIQCKPLWDVTSVKQLRDLYNLHGFDKHLPQHWYFLRLFCCHLKWFVHNCILNMLCTTGPFVSAITFINVVII